ncbi:MAG: thiamine-phosphate kinase [Acidobacteriaceae bacterium]
MHAWRSISTGKRADAVFWQSMPHPPIAGERAFIRSLRKQLARSGQPDRVRPRGVSSRTRSRAMPEVTLGMGDDCAILQPPANHEILVTTDFSLETVHFRRDWHTPESVGHRCLARGLSDIAAMGAQPLAAFLSLALPAELVGSRTGQLSWRERFLDGFLALADEYHLPLAGGDTAQSPLLPIESSPRLRQNSRPPATGWALADIVLVGSAPRHRALRRSTAKAGDLIYITGSLGGAAAELARLAAHPSRFRLSKPIIAEPGMANPHPHLFPEPRLAVGAWLLQNRRATSAIDISDGLSTDLDHLCEESKLAATVDAAAIPIHPIAQKDFRSQPEKALQIALNGGEDYELLFTASPAARIPRRIAGVPIACIGEMRAHKSRAPRVLLAEIIDGRKATRPLPAAGWEHLV